MATATSARAGTPDDQVRERTPKRERGLPPVVEVAIGEGEVDLLHLELREAGSQQQALEVEQVDFAFA